MSDHACGFVHHDEVFVLIDNFDRNIFRHKVSRRQWRKFHFNRIICAELVRSFDDAPVDQDLGVFDQPLQTRAAPTFDLRREKRVEALACGFVCNKEVFDTL